MRASLKSSSLFALFLLCFLGPYLWLLPQADFSKIGSLIWGAMYGYSFLQALISTVITLVLGMMGALGLFWAEHRLSPSRYMLFELFVLAPALLPPLFLVVPTLNLISDFPFGFPGVVIFHAMAETGIAAMAFKKIFYQRLSPYVDSATLMGCSVLRFVRKTTRLWLSDLCQMSFVFLIYFLTSFSIPLLIGGSSFSSLEVSIYEKIVVHHNWPEAISLFACQFSCIALLIWLLSQVQSWPTESTFPHRLELAEKGWGLIPIVIPPSLLFGGLIYNLPRGVELLFFQSYVLENWQGYMSSSLFLGFVTGGAIFATLSLVTYFLQFKAFRNFFSTFFTPSFVVLGFVFYFIPGQNMSWVIFKIAVALSFAFVPTLLRLGLFQKVMSLEPQLEMAAFLGAQPAQVFWKITWPQCLPLISRLSGLAGVWAVGDFSLSRVVAGSDINLAMWVQSLIEHYRWDIALLLSWLILLCALIVFGFFWGLAYVAHQELS